MKKNFLYNNTSLKCDVLSSVNDVKFNTVSMFNKIKDELNYYKNLFINIVSNDPNTVEFYIKDGLSSFNSLHIYNFSRCT